jgi:hypothetical protein
MPRLEAKLAKSQAPPPSIWLNSIYRFVVPHQTPTTTVYKELFFDVTKSAPNFGVGKELKDTFDWALRAVGSSNPTILDFGAGRLRNTIYLLRKGNSVAAVEFQKLNGSRSVEGFGTRFRQLIFPHEFFSSLLKYDLIILVNVLSIMPVPAERSLVLKYCRQKLKENGLILWYSQTTQSFYNDKNTVLGDGIVLHEGDKYKTFYKDYAEHEIDELFAASGLRLAAKKVVPHVTARLYKTVGDNPLEQILDGNLIRRYVEGDLDYGKPSSPEPQVLKGGKGKTQVNIPNPPELAASRLYEKALRNIEPGREENHTYQSLVGAIFAYLFMPPLENMEFERDINDGLGRIDIVFRNSAKRGVFNHLRSSYQIKCPYIYVECKNLSHDLSNTEFNQLAGRFVTTRNHFGILVCRGTEDRERVLQHAKAVRTHEENMVIWLDDSDLITLLRSSDDRRDVNDLLEERVEEVDL